MFGPHDSQSAARGARYVLVRASLLLAPVIVTLGAGPMLLILLPLAFAGLPFLLVSFLSGTSSNHMETRRMRAFRPAAI